MFMPRGRFSRPGTGGVEGRELWWREGVTGGVKRSVKILTGSGGNNCECARTRGQPPPVKGGGGEQKTSNKRGPACVKFWGVRSINNLLEAHGS